MSGIHKYVIEKQGEEWCLLSNDGGAKLGCYPTRAEAVQRLRQVEAHKRQEAVVESLREHGVELTDVTPESIKLFAKRFEIRGVEIFRTGTFKGDRYTTKDLDDMVAAFGRVGFDPAVKVGHTNDSSDPAFGFISAIRRVGDKLVADFRDVPESIYQQIKERRFDRISAEIGFNMDRGGTKFRRVLTAVALLGSAVPAVPGLKPLRDVVFDQAAMKTVTLSVEDIAMSDKDDKQAEEMQALRDQVAELTRKLSESTDKQDSDAVLKVKQLSDELKDRDERLKALEDSHRQERIRNQVRELNVPRFRSHFESLYELAHKARKLDDAVTVSFAATDDKGERQTGEVDPTKVIDDLLQTINKHFDVMFQQVATHEDAKALGIETNQNVPPAQELDRLTKEYMAKHDIDSAKYYETFAKVCQDPANAELVKRYNAGTPGNFQQNRE